MKKKILIIDDNADFCKLLAVRLKADGYDTAAVGNPMEITETIKNNMPDLILMDLGLPILDGFSLMESFKSIPALANVPIIVITGRETDHYNTWAKQYGAAAFFRKPFDNDELLAAIHKALDRV